MKRLKKYIILLLLVLEMTLSLSGCTHMGEIDNMLTSNQDAVQAPKLDARQISAKSVIQAAAHYSGADSMQYVVWEKGKITLSGHLGTYSRTEKRSLTDDELYNIGSASKIYTAVAKPFLRSDELC